MKKLRVLAALVLVFSLLLAACGQAAPAPVQDTPVAEAAPPAPAQDDADDADDEDDEDENDIIALDVTDVIFGSPPATLPRNETLYIGGVQWGPVITTNPFSTNPNNGLAVRQVAVGSTLLMYETLYMFNMLDGTLHPLLAGGDPAWNDDSTIITVPLNQDAGWSDGTQVTAHDVIATFNAHVQVSSPMGLEYGPFIDQVIAIDDFTAAFHLSTDNHNPLMVLEYLQRVFVLQQDYIELMFERYGNDYMAFRDSPWHDAPHTGPYSPLFYSAQMVVFQRNENYWGQAPSMWGQLPTPRYVVHNIYASNDTKRASFAAGQIDVNNQFITNVWEMWEDGLPVSTFLDEAPFYLMSAMAAIHFNTQRPGLDQLAVRQAIAYAIDYEQIIQAAVSGYSYTFEQVPRSIASPLAGEQRFVDNDALAHLQWGSRDIERANQILDDAGIIDTTGDGWREWDGENMSFLLMCPMGWNDWEASLEIVAAAGAEIGIQLSTSFVESALWTESRQAGNFDIIMAFAPPTSIAAPWNRAFNLLYVTDPDADRLFWAYHRMYNPEINDLISRAAAETDEAVLREYFTEISRFMLEEKPFIYLFYRNAVTHTVNESVWTGFPEAGDGTNIPPTAAIQGYGISTMFNLRLAE